MKFVLFLLLISSAFAQELRYLTPESVDLSAIPLPPEAGSVEDQMDMLAVREWQINRTSEDCSRATVESQGYASSFYGYPYGPLFTWQAERLVEFQEMLFQEVKYFSKILKAKYERHRPFKRDTSIIPCIPLENSLPYPSGHAAIAVVSAKTFSLIYPEHKKEFMKRARVIANDRVVGGVHHPTDVQAGFILGEKTFEALSKNEKFMKDVKKIFP